MTMVVMVVVALDNGEVVVMVDCNGVINEPYYPT